YGCSAPAKFEQKNILKQALRKLMMYQRLYLARKSSRQIKKLLTARML
ncbi:hypothetical protein HMPREF9443_00466, partial [Phascolarctobacterium succinatutens YIT 12067]